MKKTILISALTLLLGFAITAFVYLPKTSKKENGNSLTPVSKGYVLKLKEAGFTRIKNVVEHESEAQREYYAKKYGLFYLSDEELRQLLRDNGFLVGASSFFIGEMPDSAANTLIKNLDLVSANEEKFDRYDYPLHEFVTQPEALARWEAHYRMYDIGIMPLVFIAAPSDKFDLSTDKVQLNENMFVMPKNNDPIALYKVKGGWIELARW